MTTEELVGLFEMFGLHDGIADAAAQEGFYGGLIQATKVLLALKDNTESRELLRDVFGNAWLDHVELSNEVVTQDVLGERVAAFGSYDPFADNDDVDGSHYFFHKTSLDSISGEKLVALTERAFQYLENREDDPCPYDKILIAIVIIAVTIYTAGQASSVAAQWVASLSGAIAAGQTLGIVSTHRDVQYVQAALALFGGYQAATADGAKVAATYQFALQVAQTSLQVYTNERTDKFEEEMGEKQAEIKRIEDQTEAELFETGLEFVFDGSYSAPVRMGPETNPDDHIRKMYAKFSVY